MDKSELQKVYDELCKKINKRSKELQDVEAEIAEVVRSLTYAASVEKRKGLVAQRRDKVDERDALLAEIELLKSEKKIAYLTIFENELVKAQNEMGELLKERSELATGNFRGEQMVRDALREELKDIPSYKERDKKIVEVELQLAESRAKAFVNQKNMQRVRNTIRRFEMDLQNARVEVEGW